MEADPVGKMFSSLLEFQTMDKVLKPSDSVIHPLNSKNYVPHKNLANFPQNSQFQYDQNELQTSTEISEPVL
jgi:hypothetical protein